MSLLPDYKKYVIIGAGIHGLSTAWHLAKELKARGKGSGEDIIVLDKDPLVDIHNINSVIYTIVNGRLYETETMNEIGNYNKPRSRFYWEQEGYNDNFEWHAESQSFTGISCSCQH